MFLKNILILNIFFIVIGCAKSTLNEHTISNIPEASGIAYCKNSDSLVVANDEGIMYELSTEGKIFSKYRLGKYDLEGVVCHDSSYVFAVENGALLMVDRATKSTELLKVKGKNFNFGKKSGIEGITYNKGLYYLSIQAKNKKSAKFIVVKIGKNYAKIIDTVKHGIQDASGLQYSQEKIYIVSDKKDKLFIYDLKKDKVIKKIKLDKFSQEGITFDTNKNAYFADDDGSIKKYTFKELGLKKM